MQKGSTSGNGMGGNGTRKVQQCSMGQIWGKKGAKWDQQLSKRGVQNGPSWGVQRAKRGQKQCKKATKSWEIGQKRI